MMKRTETRRVVEFLDGDEDDGYASSRQAAHIGDFARGLPGSGSLTMTMTPTSRFMEQPILLDIVKDNTSTGSSTTLPGMHGRPRGSADPDGTLRGQYDHPVHDELLKVHYLSPPMARMAIAGIVGLALGIVLSRVKLQFEFQWWIGLTGWMYLCLLECLALPLIFTSVTLCVAQLVQSTKGRSIMLRLGIMFVVAAFLASGTGILTSYALSSTFTRQTVSPVELPKAVVGVECPNEMLVSPRSRCDGVTLKDLGLFTITNVTGITIQATGEDVVEQDVSFATQIVNFFTVMFQQNITEAFTTQSYLGISIFAMFIGAGLVISQDFPDMHGSTNYLFHILKQVDVVLEMMLNWLIVWIPLGTLDGMTFTIMVGVVTNDTFRRAIVLPLILLLALVINFFLVVCVGYYVFVRKNPFSFFWYLMPALIYRIASQRSLATVPVMMRSIERSKQVSRTLAQFTISLGTALSMCGTACYFSIACVFMAYTSGLEHELTAGRFVLLFIVSALSSFGTPVGAGQALTYVATIWFTVFNTPPPDSLAFVVSMEWLTQRMRNVYNITVVAFMARVIAEQLDETAEDEDERMMMAATTHGDDSML